MCAHFASAGISEHGTWFAWFLQSEKKCPRVCQCPHIDVLFIFAWSAKFAPTKVLHCSPSLSLKLTHWFFFLTPALVAFSFCSFVVFSLSFSFLRFPVFFPFLALVSESPFVTPLKHGGRVALKWLSRILLRSSLQSIRESSVSSQSSAWVQLSRKSWNRVQAVQRTFDGKNCQVLCVLCRVCFVTQSGGCIITVCHPWCSCPRIWFLSKQGKLLVGKACLCSPLVLQHPAWPSPWFLLHLCKSSFPIDHSADEQPWFMIHVCRLEFAKGNGGAVAGCSGVWLLEESWSKCQHHPFSKTHIVETLGNKLVMKLFVGVALVFAVVESLEWLGIVTLLVLLLMPWGWCWHWRDAYLWCNLFSCCPLLPSFWFLPF